MSNIEGFSNLVFRNLSCLETIIATFVSRFARISLKFKKLRALNITS